MISFILSLVIVCLLGSYLCIEADRVLKVEDGDQSVQPIYDTQIQDGKMQKKQVERSEMVSVSVDEKVESSQNKKASEGTHQALVCQDNEDVDMSLDIQESELEPDVQDIKGEDLVSQSLYVLEVGHQYGVNDLFVGLNKDVYMRMDDYWFVADDIGQVSVELYFDYHDNQNIIRHLLVLYHQQQTNNHPSSYKHLYLNQQKDHSHHTDVQLLIHINFEKQDLLP